MNIPGYQYDPEKNRYFKVLKSGELPNSPYTISALASSARHKERARRSEFSRECANNSNINSQLPEWSHKIGTKLQTFLPGKSADHVVCFDLIECGTGQWDAGARRLKSRFSPVAGYRDGILATASSKTDAGRSIVAIEYTKALGTVAAAVDNACGSIIVTADRILTQVPNAFVSAMTVKSQVVLAASAIGLTVVGTDLVPRTLSMGPLSSVAHCDDRAACGGKNGKVQLFDVATSQTDDIFTFPNKRAVTNLGISDNGLIVATGLEDHMYLLDARIGGPGCMVKQYEYSNWSHILHGFSFAPHSGSEFAVTQENSVVIYNIQGGVQARIPTKNVTAPCIKWTDEGMFIGVKNAIKLVSKRRMVPDQSIEENVEAIHEQLNKSTETRDYKKRGV